MIRDTSAQDRQVSTPPSQDRRKWLLLAGGGLLLLILTGSVLGRWLSGDRSVDGQRLRIAEVTRGDLVRDAAVNGRVVAAVSPTLYAPVTSTVSLKIAAGDAVKEGDILAELDSPELTNELERERATLISLETEVSRQRIQANRARLTAQRTADEAEIALVAAQRDLQRTERAFEAGALSQVDHLQAKDALRNAEIKRDHAASDAALESRSAVFELKTREQALQRQQLLVTDLVRRVDELKVRSPVDGIVGTLSVADRAVVPPNTPIMTVVDLSRLEVELEVAEAYADDLGIGMAAEVRIGSITAMGKLSAISPEVVNRQVLARVRFDGEQPAGLRQNQRVAARVLIEEKPDVLVLARGPFVETHGGRHAYVLRDGIAERTPVQIGATSVGAVEVLGGLQAGDRVVIAGSDSFGDAERVFVND
jgi:HlyD family secretion protein